MVVVMSLRLVAFIAGVAAEVGAVSDMIFIMFDESFCGSDCLAALAGDTWKTVVNCSCVCCQEVHFLEDFTANVTSKSVKESKFHSKETNFYILTNLLKVTCDIVFVFLIF